MKSNNRGYDLSVCIDIEYGDIAIYKTLRSVAKALHVATEMHISYEIVVLLRVQNIDTSMMCIEKIRQIYQDLNVRIVQNIQQEFISRSDALNSLADEAKGEYVVYVDDGDLVTPHYFATLIEILRKNEGAAVFSGFELSFEADHRLLVQKDFSKMMHKYALFDQNIYTVPIACRATIVKRLLRFNDCGDNDTVLRDWYLRAIDQGLSLEVNSNSIYFRRYRRDVPSNENAINTNSLPNQNIFKPSNFLRIINSNDHSINAAYSSEEQGDTFVSKIKNRVRHYHIAYHYAQVQWNLHKNVAKALYGLVFPVKGGTVSAQEAVNEISKGVPDRIKSIGIGEELIKEWANINTIEPMIRPSWDMMKYIPIENRDNISVLGSLYEMFCIENEDNIFDHIILVPHLVRGGADMAAINLTKRLVELGRVLLITTTTIKSSWLSEIDKVEGAEYIDASDFAGNVSDKNLRHFIEVIAQNFSTKTITVINSEVGYRIARYDKELVNRMGCRIILHAYAYDMTEDGFIFNWLQNALVYAYDGVDKFITDSHSFANQLSEINGFSPEKIGVLYLPIAGDIKSKHDYGRKNSILWASRVHNNKLVETLIEIADTLKESGINIDMYGALDIEYQRDNKLYHMLSQHSNIQYKGSYEGFGSLPINNYDMLLLTTKNEGMPNVLLEACKANLYIIAPEVGGVGEIIKNTKNGRMIPFEARFDAKEYSDAILESYRNNEFSDMDEIKKNNRQIVTRHSQKAYGDSVDEIYRESPAANSTY